MSEPNKKFLTSKEEIMTFLGVKDAVFAQFIKIKLPIVIVNGRYYAHTENLEAWFKGLTSQQRPEIVVQDDRQS